MMNGVGTMMFSISRNTMHFWVWSIVVIWILLTIIIFLYIDFLGVIPMFSIAIIFLLLFLCCWVIGIPGAMQDRYQDTINPTIEQIDF